MTDFATADEGATDAQARDYVSAWISAGISLLLQHSIKPERALKISAERVEALCSGTAVPSLAEATRFADVFGQTLPRDVAQALVALGVEGPAEAVEALADSVGALDGPLVTIADVKAWAHAARRHARPTRLTRSELAARLGVPESVVSSWESVRLNFVPPRGALAAIAHACGLPLPSLRVDLDDPPWPLVEGVPIDTTAALKAWIRTARRFGQAGRLTVADLASAMDERPRIVALWESPASARLPNAVQVEEIARACGVGRPRLAESLAREAIRGAARRPPIEVEPASDLTGEVFNTGRRLASIAYPEESRERNARIFLKRFSANEPGDTTLQALGDEFGMTRERVRQILDKLLAQLPFLDLDTAHFARLADACPTLAPQSVRAARETLATVLGSDVGLGGAYDYGVLVLGRKLPLEWVQAPGELEAWVAGGQRAHWYPTAINVAKRLIRYSGAAQILLGWAATQRECGEAIAFDDYHQAMVQTPGFSWVDEEESWFWLGALGSANRMIEWTLYILAEAGRALDVEMIYSGIARYSRNRESSIATEAGVAMPIAVFRQLLQACGYFECLQGDNFRLAPSAESLGFEARSMTTRQILEVLRGLGGVASRRELRERLVDTRRMNVISFSVALSISPLLRQLDYGLYAIRGVRLTPEAMARAQASMASSTIAVEAGDGLVSWTVPFTASTLDSHYIRLPARAQPRIAPGDYVVVPNNVRVEVLGGSNARITGLARVLIAAGAREGTAVQLMVEPDSRTIAYDFLEAHTAD
jgi:transcriptional regulator with XRE-family HTH domain